MASATQSFFPVISGSADPGTRLSAGGNQANLDFTGLDGAAAGDYVLSGEWVGRAAETDLLLQVNAIATGYFSSGVISTTGAPTSTNTGNFGAGANTVGHAIGRGGPAGRNRVKFRVEIRSCGTAGFVYMTGRATSFDSTTSGQTFQSFTMDCIIATAGKVTELTLVTADASSVGIQTGSFAVLSKLGVTA